MNNPVTKGKGRGMEWLRAHLDYKGESCLVWPFFRLVDGRGVVGLNGRVRKASRVMCELKRGKPPTALHHAAHLCGNAHLGCVHPEHLVWKTPKENGEDAARHGAVRSARKARPKYKLTPEQVAEIWALKGLKTQLELGAMFGVTAKNIGAIYSGRRWPSARPE